MINTRIKNEKGREITLINFVYIKGKLCKFVKKSNGFHNENLEL